MKYQDVIDETREHVAEWTEMIENPDELIIRILAQKIVNLKIENDILESRLHSLSCRF